MHGLVAPTIKALSDLDVPEDDDESAVAGYKDDFLLMLTQ